MLSLGMRRPNRLQEVENLRGIIGEGDFGLEATFPSHMTVQSKRKSIAIFIWLCKLSNIMAELAHFQRGIQFERDWNTSGTGGSITESEFHQVLTFDKRLHSWRKDFEAVVKASSRGPPPDDNNTGVYILRLISE